MFEFRVTKYDPADRDADGAFRRDAWTSIDDIGRRIAGVVLTEAEYERTEDAYVTVALGFLREAGVSVLVVTDLEDHAQARPPIDEGAVLSLDEVGMVIRLLLQERFWCRLEAAGGFIHLGRDYYLYVGVGRECPASIELARRCGLFVEPFGSPYSRGVDA